MNAQTLALQVGRFYAQARQDRDLGPIFADTIDDWPRHEAALTAFWCQVMGVAPEGYGAFHGNPMAKHLALRDRMSPALFERWLALWTRTAQETVPPDAAHALIAKAQRIAQSLQLGLFYRPGQMSGPCPAQTTP